jgi:hypothetical protein
MLAGKRELDNLPADEPVVARFKMPITHPRFQKSYKELAE